MKKRKINSAAIMLKIGATGFLITLFFNLFGEYLLKQAAATPFSSEWWSMWFVNYLVWGIFILIGLTISFTRKHLKQPASRTPQ